MMNKYLYIPIELEESLASMQQAWLGQSDESFTIVTGVYVPCNENEVDESNSNVLNQAKLSIKRGNKNTSFGTKTYNRLTGFCVEVNDNDISFDLPNSVIIFNTSDEFLEFINKLNNDISIT